MTDELDAAKAEARHLSNNLSVQRAGRVQAEDLVERLRGERGTALQAASCYKAQRDLAWAEIDRLKAATSEGQHV